MVNIGNQQDLKEGTILFQQGQASNYLFLVHHGAVDYFYKDDANTYKVIDINGKNFAPGVSSLFTEGNLYPYTAIVSKNSLVSIYDVKQSKGKSMIASRFNLCLLVANSLMREVQQYVRKCNQMKKLEAELLKRSDNFSIVYYCFNPSEFSGVDTISRKVSGSEKYENQSLQLTIDNLKNWFGHSDKLPNEDFFKFSQQDFSLQLDKEYITEILFNNSEFSFFSNLIRINQNITQYLYKFSPKMLLYVCEKFVDTIQELFDIFGTTLDSLHHNLEVLCGKKQSMVQNFLPLVDLSKENILRIPIEESFPFYQVMSKTINNVLSFYEKLLSAEWETGKNIELFSNKVQALEKNFKAPNNNNTQNTNIKAIREELKNSFAEITNFARLDEESKKSFYQMLSQFSALADPFDTEGESRILRKKITLLYWSTYKSCVINYLSNKKKNPTLPISVSMFLKFGFVLESFLEDEQLTFIYNNTKKKDMTICSFPIFRDIEWLEEIYTGKTVTSIDELGETFFEKVKGSPELKYQKGLKTEKDLLEEFKKPQKKLEFELDSMYSPNSRLTSGSILSYFPILHKNQIQGSLEKSFISNEIIQKTLNSILNIDTTAFNREVIHKIDKNTEFINQSIVPNFIVVPSIGARVSMWQELSVFRGAGSKTTKGRIIIPCFMQEDFKTALMKAIANFRWELSKSISGPDWNNVSIPSITSAYTDYVQFYKKNRNLSVEVKAKLTKEFKRFRNDKDRFINDYLVWLNYEASGTQRMNRVIREIMYRYVPFHKDIREKLLKVPAYANINDKVQNIKKKKLIELNNRYKRYIETENGKLPDLLQANIDFYKL